MADITTTLPLTTTFTPPVSLLYRDNVLPTRFKLRLPRLSNNGNDTIGVLLVGASSQFELCAPKMGYECCLLPRRLSQWILASLFVCVHKRVRHEHTGNVLP